MDDIAAFLSNRFRLWICAILMAGLTEAPASPIRLTVRPVGTNHLQFTISPVRLYAGYSVLVRSNSPGAYWIPLTGMVGGSNGTSTLVFDLGELRRGHAFKGVSLQNLSAWRFVAGGGEDADGDGLPDVYEDLVTRTDPFDGVTGDTGEEDGYKDPDRDNWCNHQEYTNGSDPFVWDQPPPPSGIGSRFFTNGTTMLQWRHVGSTLPDYFVVQRAVRTLRPRSQQTRSFPRDLGMREPAYDVSPFVDVAQVKAKAGQLYYKYFETNSPNPSLDEPVLRVRAQYKVRPHAIPVRSDEAGIRQTLRPVSAQRAPDGYSLRFERPVPHARYLLLCRAGVGAPWMASGYFAAGTNAAPVVLHADVHGLLPGSVQRPTAMPQMRFAVQISRAEFAAGSGEDMDGDGLPDIYEVLVTHTDPDNFDTGNTGIVDGYKDLDNDGWWNLEEFRRRANPLAPDMAPPPIQLRRPTLREATQALSRPCDLPYEPEVAIRPVGKTNYEKTEDPLMMFYQAMNQGQLDKAQANFDMLVTWRIPEWPSHREYNGPW